MGRRVLYSLVFLALFFSLELNATEGLDEMKSEIRISKLLPYLVHPPLVDPCLPDDFILGEKENDPYFSEGYYWGPAKSVQNYFDDTKSLNSCIIRAQVSTNVIQLGLNRFSSDDKINDLSVAGFTEIFVNKGKWGIFPYREIQAKGPKGRHYYQLWVGLNEEGGATIYFQLLYPEYLNEPTQNQKKIWKDFIKKTSFLSLKDLMVFHNLDKCKKTDEQFTFSIEKRLIDNKFAIIIDSQDSRQITIHEIKEYNLLTGVFKKPYLELQIDIQGEGNVKSESFQTTYTPVEEFTFYPFLLYPQSIKSYPDCFLLTKKIDRDKDACK